MAKSPKTEKPAPEQLVAAEDSADVKYPRRTERRRKTRTKILRAASDLFLRSSFSATTMQNIADAADIHVTTLFMHFNSKNDLATVLAENAVEELREHALAAQPAKTFFDFFRDEAMNYAAVRKNAGQPHAAMWRGLRHDREFAFAWALYEQGQKSVYADYIALEYNLDRATDYVPDLLAAMMVECLVLPHERWAEAPGKRKLADEIAKGVEIAELAARQVLKSHGASAARA